jgi:hypothetical protein
MFQCSLNSALVGGEWLAPHSFTQRRGGWMGPRTEPDDVENTLDTTQARTPILLKIVVFWDVRPSGSCKKRRFGGT